MPRGTRIETRVPANSSAGNSASNGEVVFRCAIRDSYSPVPQPRQRHNRTTWSSKRLCMAYLDEWFNLSIVTIADMRRKNRTYSNTRYPNPSGSTATAAGVLQDWKPTPGATR